MLKILIAVLLTGVVRSQTTAPIGGAYPANTTLCFDEIVGCFSNIAPFTNTGNYLPVSPSVLKTEFLLYTRDNVDDEQFLNYNNTDSIKNSNYNPKLPLKMIIHGFGNNRSTPWIHVLKQALLKIENCNVLVVAWGNGSAFPLYNNASSNIRLVGKQTGLVINDIRSVFYAANPTSFNVHCIGHSLGAHTCGYASRASIIPFARISALDPAGPMFEDFDPLVRVDPTDSYFVDAYHTNAGSLLTAAFGIVMASGHVDFYVNGGKFQPGCPGLTSIIGGVLGGSGADPSKDAGCSHNRIHPLFVESMTSNCGFLAFNCPNEDMFNKGECTTCAGNKCSQMGYYANKYKGRGTMYLVTNGDAPYCGYHHMFEVDIDPSSPKTKGDLTLAFDGETNKEPKTILSGEDINPSTNIKKIFVTEHDLVELKSVNFTYIKKSKPLFGSDYSKFIKVGAVKVRNIEIDETFTNCITDRPNLDDKQILKIDLEEKDCT